MLFLDERPQNALSAPMESVHFQKCARLLDSLNLCLDILALY